MTDPVGLAIEQSPIPGLVVVRLEVREDARGWFKENWQREKMVALGLPDFEPVQNNVAFNGPRGTTRGIHAEPWDKLVSVSTGRAFGAWVDLREGDSFGTAFTVEITPGVSVFVPRGVGNSYQTLEDATSYSYLVNDHWRPGTTYPALALDDPTIAIGWPIPLDDAVVSDKDRHQNPTLDAVVPMPAKKTLIIGCRGQLGRALQHDFPDADLVDIDELDLTDTTAVAAWPWPDYALVLNAAAYTAVDAAETRDGRRTAWAANAQAPATLARLAREHRFTVVHYSSDYVFDGTATEHTEEETLSPLGVYGQSKAAGDVAIATVERHYLIRTSWVIGDGKNFVRTMQTLAADGINPSVVDDQFGRLTFTTELSRATKHLLDKSAAYGTYNVSNGGPITSWADLASAVFRVAGRDPAEVTPISTGDYAAGKDLAPRPTNSALSLQKIRATGFEPTDSRTALGDYLRSE